MNKTRSAGFLAAAAMALLAPLAHAADNADQQKQQLDTMADATAAAAKMEVLSPDLSALYAAISSNLRVRSHAHGMKSMPFEGGMILVARIDEEGKVVTACVDNEEAARDFLTNKKKAAVRLPEAQ